MMQINKIKATAELADKQRMQQRLEAVFQQDPRLRPSQELHDYQLTYPPAIQLEKPQYLKLPSDEEFKQHAIGDFKNAAFYFHFGFCQYKCRYCHHYEIRTKHDEELMSRYVDAMCMEMRRVRDIAPDLRTLIYFLGGGTPTYLPPHLLERFLDTLLEVFGPPPTALSTVEVKPVTASKEKLDLLVQAGFKRINLGVQTLDPDLYAYHHHKEELSVALEAIDRARNCGFDFINTDILTGLQQQSAESWQMTLDALHEMALDGSVDSVFIYPYHDDPRSKTFNQPGKLPSILETAHSDALARDMFTRLGWKELGTRFYRSPRHVRRELIDWAKMRANPAYGELLYHGFGNSSFSVGDKSTYINKRNVNEYCDQVESGDLGISHWDLVDNRQRATRDLTFDILYSPIVRVRSIAKKYGAETMQSHIEEIERWTKMGLGSWNRLLGIWRLTPLGKLVHQEMMEALYLPQDRSRLHEVMEERLLAGGGYRGY